MKDSISFPKLPFYWRTHSGSQPNIVPNLLPFKFDFDRQLQLVQQERNRSVLEHLVFIPQIGDGVGWRTQINISFTGPTEGSIEFFDSLGNPLILDMNVSDLGDVRTNFVPFGFDPGPASSLIVKSLGLSDPFVSGYAEINFEADPKEEVRINALFRHSSYQPRMDLVRVFLW